MTESPLPVRGNLPILPVFFSRLFNEENTFVLTSSIILSIIFKNNTLRAKQSLLIFLWESQYCIFEKLIQASIGHKNIFEIIFLIFYPISGS